MEDGTPACRCLKAAFAFALAAATLVLAYWLRTDLLLGFLAIVLAVLLDAVAEFGIRFLRLRRGIAVVLATILFLLTVGAALTLIAVPLARQGTDFVQKLPKRVARLEGWAEHYRREFPWLERFWPESQNQSPAKLQAPELAKKAIITASATLEWMATALATFFLALFLALNPERWLQGVAGLGPGPGTARRIALLRRMGQGLRSYLLMTGLYVVLMGAAWTLGLWAIGIDYPLLFGAIGGMAEVVPYVGPMVGLVPPLLLALTAGKVKILEVLGLYAVLHVLEGYALVPFLMHRREHLPSPLVVLSVLMCGRLFGTLGVVLALPLATAGYLLAVETLYPEPNRESDLRRKDER